MCWWLEKDPCEILPGREAVCFSGPLLSPRLRPQGRNKGHVSYMHSQSIEDLWLSEYVDMLVFLTKLWKLSLTMSEVLLLQKIKKKKYFKGRKRQTITHTESWNTWAVFSAITKIMTAHPGLLGGKFPYFCFRGTFKAIYCHNSYTAGLRTICLLKSARGYIEDLLI